MKLNKKNCLIALIILLLIIFEIFNPINWISSYAVRKQNYSNDSTKRIMDLGLKSKVLDHDYSEFIDKNILSNDFDINKYEVYKELNYSKTLNDVGLINDIIDKGYNIEEINCILKAGDNESATLLLEKDRYENIADFLNFDYAKLKNLDRYINYQMKTLSDYNETVLYVELELDKDFYTDCKIVDKFSYDMFVNKYNQLSNDYEPNNLVKVNNDYSVSDDNFGNQTMLDNFYKMADAINSEMGLKIYIRSAYRSFESQEDVYNQYLKAYGKEYVKKYVAYPGFSEHQTGLAVDIKASSSNVFENTKESKWLIDNAHKYGFIQRYGKNKENITGYQKELWHYRYVGQEIATYIKEKKITFDEYYIMFLSK